MGSMCKTRFSFAQQYFSVLFPQSSLLQRPKWAIILRFPNDTAKFLFLYIFGALLQWRNFLWSIWFALLEKCWIVVSVLLGVIFVCLLGVSHIKFQQGYIFIFRFLFYFWCPNFALTLLLNQGLTRLWPMHFFLVPTTVY